MIPRTLDRRTIHGPTGKLEVAINTPNEIRGIALVAHPNPLEGGTLDNKVVYTLAKAFFQFGFVAVRFNYRGVGKSEGTWGNGDGEVADAQCVLEYARSCYPQTRDLPLALAGFSFGTYVQARVAQQETPAIMVFVGTAAKRFAMENVPEHTLAIHGENDEVIPLTDVLDWARPQQLPVLVVPGCGHFFHRRLVQLKNIVAQHIAGRLAAR